MRVSIRRAVASEAIAVAKGRKGFALVEVIVAMVLLAVAVSSLAALVYSVSRSGLVATGNAYRNGVLMQEVNRLEGIPYDSIHVGTSSVTVSGGKYPHTRSVDVKEPSLNLVKTITVVIKPANAAFKPDTAIFIRTKSRTSKVLCTDCPQG
jgi:prepilin-type N-terminal cleavage/methylation domain-containing protein